MDHALARIISVNKNCANSFAENCIANDAANGIGALDKPVVYGNDRRLEMKLLALSFCPDRCC